MSAAGSGARQPVGLVMAKAPLVGKVKTRLGASIGAVAAAELAAEALLDTIQACSSAFTAERCYLALAGSLPGAVGEHEIVAALEGWTVVPQHGEGLALRLRHAHEDVGAVAGPVVQVGMDTPQLDPTELAAIGEQVSDPASAVLGPAYDGGWWLLAVGSPHLVRGLSGVPMSTTSTFEATRAALIAAGARVRTARPMRDVDTVLDADAVAATDPRTRFARSWSKLSVGVAR